MNVCVGGWEWLECGRLCLCDFESLSREKTVNVSMSVRSELTEDAMDDRLEWEEMRMGGRKAWCGSGSSSSRVAR